MYNTRIRRILKEHSITKWSCERHPKLTQRVADLRYNKCTPKEDWTLEQWAVYLFSDVCSAERGKGKTYERAFGTLAQKWYPDKVYTYRTGKNLKVMVGTTIWLREKSNLFIIDKDFKSKTHGYSANYYLEVLENQIPWGLGTRQSLCTG